MRRTTNDRTLTNNYIKRFRFLIREYEVFQTDNGAEGIELARHYKPDLILCDIMLPEMDGFQILANLRHDDKTSQIPFIFITSLADRANFRAGMELGADDYITKPFTIKELTTAIRIRLEMHYANQLSFTIENIEKSIRERLHKLEKQIERQKTHISEISESNEMLNLQLKTKESELFEEVFKSIETNSTLLQIKSHLETEIDRKDLNEAQKEVLKSLFLKIERIGNKKDSWRILQLKFNQAYPNFVAKITLRYPDLTQLELTIMSTIIFNMNSSQVASMLNVSPESIRKSRYRLKKRLKLKPDESLFNYIHELNMKDQEIK